MGATRAARVLGSRVHTGLGEAAGSPGPRAAVQQLLLGETNKVQQHPWGVCGSNDCWLPQW